MNNYIAFRPVLLGALITVWCSIGALQDQTTRHGTQNIQGPETTHLSGRIIIHASLELKGEKKTKRIEGIIAIDPATGKWTKLTEGGDRGRVSPDGEHLVFVKDSKTWIAPIRDGTILRRVHETGGAPQWSSDGKEILAHKGDFIKGKGWSTRHWRVRIDGSRTTRIPVPPSDEVSDWSSDGAWLVTTSDRHPPHGNGYQLYVMSPDGRRQKRVTKAGLNCYARFSPDAKRILYLHTERNWASLRVVGIDGKGESNIFLEEGSTAPDSGCWSPDGKHIVVMCFDWEKDNDGTKTISDDPRKAKYHLVIMNPDGKDRRVLPLRGARVLRYGHCPDWR